MTRIITNMLFSLAAPMSPKFTKVPWSSIRSCGVVVDHCHQSLLTLYHSKTHGARDMGYFKSIAMRLIVVNLDGKGAETVRKTHWETLGPRVWAPVGSA